MAISALITGSGGGFTFEQQPYSPYPIEDLEWEKGIPGGDLSATIWTRFRGPFQLPSLNSLVTLNDLVGPWWLGLFDHADIEYWSGGANVALHCVGWSAIADDRVYTQKQVFTVGQTAGDMFRHARDNLCPGISSDNSLIHANAETTLSEETKNFRGDPAIAVWNSAAALGSVQASPEQLIWLVRQPFGTALPPAVPVLEVFPLANAPSYSIDLQHGYSIRTKVERQQVRNHILVNYGTGTGDPLHEPAAQNVVATAFSLIGFAELNYRERQMWVDASSEFDHAAFFAQRIADVNLSKYGVVHGSGFTVMIPFDGTGAHPILDGATPIPIWRMNPGRLLSVNNDQSWAGLPNNPTRSITHIHGSLKKGAIQVTTGLLGDSRQAQRMTGVPTLRQLMDLPPLSRPNRPEEWQRVEFELGPMDAQDDPVFVMVEFPHILRTITVFAIALQSESQRFQSLDVEIGHSPQGSWSDPPSYTMLAQQTVGTPRTQIATGLNQKIEPGEFYVVFMRNAVPTGVRALVVIGADRRKVVE